MILSIAIETSYKIKIAIKKFEGSTTIKLYSVRNSIENNRLFSSSDSP